MTTHKNHDTKASTSKAHTDEQKKKSEVNKVDRPVNSTASITPSSPPQEYANIEPGTYVGMLVEQIQAESSVRSSVNVLVRGIAGHMKAWSDDQGKIEQLADTLLSSAGTMADAAASSIEVERAA